MPKLQENKGKSSITYSITIPYELVKSKGWKKGSVLFLAFNERGNIEIKD